MSGSKAPTGNSPPADRWRSGLPPSRRFGATGRPDQGPDRAGPSSGNRPPWKDRLYPAIGLLSGALVGVQIIWMQALAQWQWSHFAHMIIAMAMLGFGASGTLLALAHRKLCAPGSPGPAFWMLPAAISMALTLHLANLDFARFDMLELFMGGGRHRSLFVGYLIFFVPVFFGAIAIGRCFTAAPERSGSIYAWNLAGSALGGPAALGLLSLFPATVANGVMALVALIAAWMAAGNRKLRFGCIVSGVAILSAIWIPVNERPSVYKDISRARDLPQAVESGPIPSPHGEVRSISSPALRYAPGLSLNFRGDLPTGEALFVNGNARGQLLSADPAQGHILDFTPRALPYAVRRPESVLILHTGAGEDVGQALSQGVPQILAIEPHPEIRAIAARHFNQSEAGRKVRWKRASARAFTSAALSRPNPPQFDLIVLPAIGQFGSDSGLGAVEQDYSLTLEAFREYLQLLSADGILCVTVWIDYPPRQVLRLAMTLAECIQAEWDATEPAEHLIGVRNWASITWILSREPLAAGTKDRVADFANEMGFDVIHPGRGQLETTTPRHATEDTSLDDGLIAIFGDAAEPFVRAHPFDISATSDDRPYFHQYLKPSSWRVYRDWFMSDTSPFLEVGMPLLLLTFVQIAVVGLPLILLPGLTGWRHLRGFAKPSVYFVAVGIGFMLWEITMIQRFILYWGHPIAAASGVISTLLLGMGAGSLLSNRFKHPACRASTVTLGLCALLLIYALALPWFLQSTLHLPMTVRALAGVMILLPPAVLMGIPFPLGIRWIQDPERIRIAWAWGLDGYASVVSATAALVIALLLGLNVPVWLAAIAYGTAGWAALASAKAPG